MTERRPPRARILRPTTPSTEQSRAAARRSPTMRRTSELDDRLISRVEDRLHDRFEDSQIPDPPVLEDHVVDGADPGRSIDVPGRARKSQLCIAGQGLQLSFTPHSGTVVIGSLSALVRAGNPGGGSGKPDADPESPNADDFTISFQPSRVQITAPGFNRTFEVDAGTLSGNDPRPTLPVIEVAVPSSAAGKLWTVTVFNRAGARSKITVTASFLKDRHRSFVTRVPISLLNGAARELVKGLGLELRLDGSDSFIDFSDDLKRHAGGALERRRFPVPLTNDINLHTAAVSVTTVGDGRSRRLVVEVFARFEQDGRELVVPGVGFDLATADLVELGVRTRFTIDQRLRYSVEVDAAIGVEGNISFVVLDAVLSAVTGALSVFTGGGADSTDAEEIIGEVIEAFERRLNDRVVRGAVQSFLRSGVMELVARGRQFHHMTITPTHLLVEHFDPDDPNPPGRRPLPRPSTVEPTEDDIADAARVQSGIDHVVVLMMENRSFDHLLGYLSLPAPVGFGRTDVDGLRGDETNSGVGVHVTAELIDGTAFPFSPDHSLDGAAAQINGGKMDGFLTDFINNLGNDTFVDGHHPLQYYNHKRMGTYAFLAENYTVCDCWFCTHPGPTWPNRFCTLSGQTPQVGNLKLNDPDLGYIDIATVFDRLGPDDWRVYESDVSFLRMYDRYRLNDSHIRPIGSFVDDVEAGLPMFTFIEPDYTDVLPIDRAANDDHPPVDLRNGQRFVAWIYDTLRRASTWGRTMFVITYDEHGGFFDHVPPAGLDVERPADDSAAVGPLPLVHPDGLSFTGPRVPAFVISPWVDAGASSVFFEHTSIAKTVLQLRYGAAHPGLGDRVAASRGLGAIMRSTPRQTAGPINAEVDIPPIDPGKPGQDPGVDLQIERELSDSFHEAMRRFGLPSKPSADMI